MPAPLGRPVGGRWPASCCGCLDLRTGCLVIASAIIVLEIVGSVGAVVGLHLMGGGLTLAEELDGELEQPAGGGGTGTAWVPLLPDEPAWVPQQPPPDTELLRELELESELESELKSEQELELKSVASAGGSPLQWAAQDSTVLRLQQPIDVLLHSGRPGEVEGGERNRHKAAVEGGELGDRRGETDRDDTPTLADLPIKSNDSRAETGEGKDNIVHLKGSDDSDLHTNVSDTRGDAETSEVSRAQSGKSDVILPEQESDENKTQSDSEEIGVSEDQPEESDSKPQRGASAQSTDSSESSPQLEPSQNVTVSSSEGPRAPEHGWSRDQVTGRPATPTDEGAAAGVSGGQQGGLSGHGDDDDDDDADNDDDDDYDDDDNVEGATNNGKVQPSPAASLPPGNISQSGGNVTRSSNHVSKTLQGIMQSVATGRKPSLNSSNVTSIKGSQSVSLKEPPMKGKDVSENWNSTRDKTKHKSVTDSAEPADSDSPLRFSSEDAIPFSSVLSQRQPAAQQARPQLRPTDREEKEPGDESSVITERTEAATIDLTTERAVTTRRVGAAVGDWEDDTAGRHPGTTDRALFDPDSLRPGILTPLNGLSQGPVLPSAPLGGPRDPQLTPDRPALGRLPPSRSSLPGPDDSQFPIDFTSPLTVGRDRLPPSLTVTRARPSAGGGGLQVTAVRRRPWLSRETGRGDGWRSRPPWPQDIVFTVEEAPRRPRSVGLGEEWELQEKERQEPEPGPSRELAALARYQRRALLVASCALVVVTLACNVSLAVGALRRRPAAVLVWLVWHGAVFMASTVGAVLSAWQRAAAPQPAESEPRHRALSGLLTAASFFVVVFYWYCFVVVLSFHMQLRSERPAKAAAESAA